MYLFIYLSIVVFYLFIVWQIRIKSRNPYTLVNTQY